MGILVVDPPQNAVAIRRGEHRPGPETQGFVVRVGRVRSHNAVALPAHEIRGGEVAPSSGAAGEKMPCVVE